MIGRNSCRQCEEIVDAGHKFHEAHQVCPGESVAKGIVLLIDDLFGIDAEARAQNLDLVARDGLRQQPARPLLETIRQKIEAARERLCRPASWAARSPPH